MDVVEKEERPDTTVKKSEIDPVTSNVDGRDEGLSIEVSSRSLVHQVFGGKMTTVYRCLACGTESHHQDFFTDLHLAFPNQRQTEELTVDHLLRNYLFSEKLAGDNRYHVSK